MKETCNCGVEKVLYMGFHNELQCPFCDFRITWKYWFNKNTTYLPDNEKDVLVTEHYNRMLREY